MKKLLAIIVLGLLFGENVNAKNRPTLECVFNDADKTTTIFDLNKYGGTLKELLDNDPIDREISLDVKNHMELSKKKSWWK